jgi:hypothetical protein
MQLPVLVEPVAGNGYRACAGQPFALSAEGATREEAIHRLRQEIEGRLQTGAEIVPLEIAMPAHPLAEFAGMFRDNPLFDEWQAAMAEYRRQADEDQELP